MNITVNFTLNGIYKQVETTPGERVQKLLKRLGIASVRDSDNYEGFAGSDTILLDGKPVSAGLLLAPMLEGREVSTIESFHHGRKLSVIEQSLVDAGCVQSGYNSPAAALLLGDLLDRNPEPTRKEVKDALSGLFNRATGYEQFFQAAELASCRLKDANYKTDIVPSYRDDLEIVGKPSPKTDAARLVSGEKSYVEDRVETNAYVLKVLRSPYAHAYIRNIDVTEAKALPGVKEIFTHENVPDIYYSQAGQGFPEPSPYDRKLIGRKVRHVGDRVAAVVADTEETADKALELIHVEYEELPPVLTVEQASAHDAPVVQGGTLEYAAGAPDNLEEINKNAKVADGKIIYQFPIGAEPHKNIAARVDGGIGDLKKGLSEADTVIERTYKTSQVQCTPLETHTVYTKTEGGRIIIHASTQVPYHLRRIVSNILSISENKVRVIKERVGGGYGSKQDIILEELCAYATYVTGKSIFHQYTREEEFISCSTRKPMEITVKLGAKKDGTLTAVGMDIRSSQGPYGAHALTVPMNACSKSLPLFLCDNFHFTITSYYTTIPPTGAYQGYGAPKGNYALQMAVRELAEQLGMDHLQLVEKNRVHEGSMLEILKCLGEGREGAAAPAASCGLGPALKRGAELIEWDKKTESDNPDIKIGKGLCTVQQGSGLPGLDHSNATIKMLGDGTFLLQSGGADLGTGLDTVCAKVAAEILKTDPELISVNSGDTDTAPFDTGAYASSGTFFSGGAARNAAEKMRDKILQEAAVILEEPVKDLEIVRTDTIQGKKGSLSYSKLAWHTQSGEGSGQIVASASFTAEDASFPYGAHFCQVAVNTRTGKITVQKYYALQDCGTPINPEYALGQIYGGVLKSIGHSLYEEMLFDENGRCLNSNFRNYNVPMSGEVPDDFRAELVETNDPYGPFGAKSVSEISVNGAAPAIANAVFDAAGIWIRSWPYKPEKVLKALGKL